MAKFYDIGDKVRVTAFFKDFDDVPVEPDTVEFYSLPPGGTATLGTVDALGGGVYQAEVDIDESGMWHFRFVGTGATAAATETSILVRRSAFV